MVTAICNIYINSEAKLGLFKETFPFVYPISDNWLVYIRGKFKQEAIEHIRSSFNDVEDRCIFFESLYDDDWAKSTTRMLEKSKYDYIYVFLEDHFLLKPIDHFKKVIRDMIKNNIDYFQYSFFNIGLPIYSIEHLYPDVTDYLCAFEFDSEKLPVLRKTNKAFYPYSLTSVSSKKYFNHLLSIENKYIIKVPILIQALMENIFFFYPRNRVFWLTINKLFSIINIRFVIYPRATPFNLEKSLFDCDEELLPIKVGGLKEEIFANWDDDNKLSNSSLIKRGLYPKYFRIDSQEKPKINEGREYILNQGQNSNHQYCPDVSRVMKIPKKHIYVKKGTLKKSSENKSFILNSGQSVWVTANIPHSFFACEDCVFHLYLDSGLQ